jgi:hypothetical protein
LAVFWSLQYFLSLVLLTSLFSYSCLLAFGFLSLSFVFLSLELYIINLYCVLWLILLPSVFYLSPAE